MIRGIEFVSKTHMAVLRFMFKDIDLSKCVWTSENFEGYSLLTLDGCDARFAPPIISGKDFQNGIYSEPIYSINRAGFKGFPSEESIVTTSTFEDYVSSDCEIAIFIYDSHFVEVYAKDLSLCKKLYENIKESNQYEELIYKTDENDGRVTMEVW